MALFCLSALAGAYALQLCSELPGSFVLTVLAAFSLAALVVPRLRLVGAFGSGFLVLAIFSQSIIDNRLEPAFVGKDVVVETLVTGFPKDNGASSTFLAKPVGRDDLPHLLRLSWFDAPPVQPNLGETWQLRLRLRRPRGFSNPGGLDYEGWLFRQGIGATGYVVNGSSNYQRVEYSVGWISRLRRRCVARIVASLPDDEASAVLMAVGVGAKHKISRLQWQRYAATGTSHLMAISGLHIGLAAGSAFFLSWLVLGLVCRRTNIRDRAAVVALLAAFSYAELSGFAVPARRALFMALLLVLAGLLRRQLSPVRLLAICGFAILVSDPLAILAPGFKLSFAAVAILYWHLRVTRKPSITLDNRLVAVFLIGLQRLSTMQMALLFGLFPLTTLLFDRVSVAAPFVNLFSVPVFNLVTVPACLLGLILDGPFAPAGDMVLEIAHRSVGVVLRLVRYAAELPLANFHVARPRGPFLIVYLLASLWSLLPTGWPGRRISLVAATAAVLYVPAPPPEGCVNLHVLDVGQGLAAVLQTHRHTLVFDAGPTFRGGTDTGSLVLVPFLRSKGIEALDVAMVSHADQDHAGGVPSLLDEIDVGRLVSGEALENVDRPQFPCQAGDRWRWDGVRFEIKHPQNPGRWRGNNASCVLEVRIARHSIILTGDIESPVERLLARGGTLLPADIVLIPHHGSRTSSSEAFVRNTRPIVAIVSAGFENRWGFPKEDVVNTWTEAGAEFLNTATSGAISYRICQEGGLQRLGLHRDDARQFWH